MAELEAQVAELQQQFEEAQQKADENADETKADSASGSSDKDSETQSLIDSISTDAAEYQGVCGADARWYYKDNVLVIKGTGEITDNPWQSVEYKVNGEYSDRIFKINWVIIDEGITAISDNAIFCNIEELTKVVLPASLVTIGAGAFLGCSSLTSINLPDSITSIGKDAFSGCSSLTSINLPDSITSIGENAFRGCRSLTSINLPDNIATIGAGAFGYCRSLDESTIQKIESITSGAYWSY